MIHIHKSKDDQFYFTVTAKNSKVLVTSEMYKKKPSALKGIYSLIRAMTLEIIFNEDATQRTYKIKDHTLPNGNRTSPKDK